MVTPLQSRTILITRPAGQSSPLADLLRAQGAIPIQIPTIALAPPASYAALDAALVTLPTYHWLLFTSANAAHAFATRAHTLNLSIHAGRVAAIGQATARAIVETGIASQVDLIPPQAVAESFATALLPHALNAHILLVRAAEARDILPQALTKAGAHLTIAEAYRTVIPQQSAQQLTELFTQNPPDAITFTSASTATNLHALLSQSNLQIPPGTVLASIGPITTQTMQSLGLTPTVEAPQATIASVVEALSTCFAQKVR